MAQVAATPAPPYYAVIFTSRRATADADSCAKMAAEMLTLAARQPGFLGVESAREALGINVFDWRDEDAILAWKRHVDHSVAQRLGREHWYEAYAVRVARVERAYGFAREDGNAPG